MRSHHGIKRRAVLFPLLLAPWQVASAVKSGPFRRGPPTLVVLHSTGGPTCDKDGRPIWVPAGNLLDNITNIESHPKLGIHYMIDRDGKVLTSIPEAQVAHHVFRYSEKSIGVELVNDGDGVDPYPEQQLSALAELLRELTRKYAIGRSGIRRHSDLDLSRMPCGPNRRRKADPGAAFPYEEVIRRTFSAE